MNFIDHLIVFIYVMIVFYIARKAKIFVSNHVKKQSQRSSTLQIEWQYLAGRTLTYWETMISAVAAEFSSLMFLVIPVLAFKGDIKFISFFLGAIPGRYLFSLYILPIIYDKGNTFFETMARGINDYSILRPPSVKAKQILSSLYFFFKIFSVAAKLSLSCVVIAELYHLPFLLILFIVILITYLYTMIGGLKAVVWTDMIQALIFVMVGVAIAVTISFETKTSLPSMIEQYIHFQKFSFSISSFIIGIFGGFLYDLSVHGSDQDFVQKFKATKTLEDAKKACFHSVLISFLVYILFFILGIAFWKFVQISPSMWNVDPAKAFTFFLENKLFSPMKGIVVSGLLASMMSSLDSALNALSLTIWNDILPTPKSKSIKHFVKIDNFIVCVFVLLFGHIFGDLGYFQVIGIDGLEWVLAMMFSFFLIRFMFSKIILFEFAPHTALLSLLTGSFGILINSFYFQLPIEYLMIFALVPTMIFFWIYGKLKLWI
jgi:SSS family solute:Na+ symporter